MEGNTLPEGEQALSRVGRGARGPEHGGRGTGPGRGAEVRADEPRARRNGYFGAKGSYSAIIFSILA